MLSLPHFSESTSVAFDGNKHRVVTEAAFSRRFTRDNPFDSAGSENLSAIWIVDESHRLEASGPITVGGPFEFAEKPVQIVSVRSVISSKTSRVHAGSSPKRIHFKPRVVGHCRAASCLADCDGFQAGVVLKGVPILDNVGQIGGSGIQINQPAEHFDDLSDLVWVRAGQHQPGTCHQVRGAEPAVLRVDPVETLR